MAQTKPIKKPIKRYIHIDVAAEFHRRVSIMCAQQSVKIKAYVIAAITAKLVEDAKKDSKKDVKKKTDAE